MPSLPARIPIDLAAARSRRMFAVLAPAAGLTILAGLSGPLRAQPETEAPRCYQTGGGLDICRSANEPEGVFFTPSPCQFAYDVQIMRLKTRIAPGPLEMIYHSEPRREQKRRGKEEACDGSLRALDPAIGGSLKMGRQSEPLATTMPPSDYRFWIRVAAEEPPHRHRQRRGRRTPEEGRAEIRMLAASREGSGGRNPMAVAGRDWAGDDYTYVFMVASETIGQSRRNVLIQGRTYDFTSLDVRSRDSESGIEDWVPFGAEVPKRRRTRRGAGSSSTGAPPLAPVTDETGKAITGNCAAEGFDVRGLVGSISVVDQVYHYFYTDVLPSDCNEPAGKRRMGLYLRTSRDVTQEKAWSSAKLVLDGLPADTLIRVGLARGMDRWALAYTCSRPASAAGGPVSDICLHYTADRTIEAISALSLFSEPVSAARSPAYLGLRSGGDGGERFGREGFNWMTDRYGNLDTPTTYPTKSGFLTWLDRTAPRSDGSEGSSLYGRPLFWATWTVRVR